MGCIGCAMSIITKKLSTLRSVKTTTLRSVMFLFSVHNCARRRDVVGPSLSLFMWAREGKRAYSRSVFCEVTRRTCTSARVHVYRWIWLRVRVHGTQRASRYHSSNRPMRDDPLAGTHLLHGRSTRRTRRNGEDRNCQGIVYTAWCLVSRTYEVNEKYF